MPTVREIIHRLLPKGTNPSHDERTKSWEVFPVRPPDMFGVMATLVFARRVGPKWAQWKMQQRDKDDLQNLWKVVYSSDKEDILVRTWSSHF